MSTCLEFRLLKKTSKKKLARIKQPNKYLYHLFSCYPKVFKDNEEKLGGLFDILDGLEYHYKRHLVYERRVSNGLPCCAACHEAVAYINRLGQLYDLFNSQWFVKYVKKEDVSQIIPSIYALMPIRNKFTAHRQQDDPRDDDCLSLGFQCFGLRPAIEQKLSPEARLKFEGNKPFGLNDLIIAGESKLVYSFPTKQRRLPGGFPPVAGIEHLGKSNNIVQFRPTEMHSVIMKEILYLIERFLVIAESKD